VHSYLHCIVLKDCKIYICERIQFCTSQKREFRNIQNNSKKRPALENLYYSRHFIKIKKYRKRLFYKLFFELFSMVRVCGKISIYIVFYPPKFKIYLCIYRYFEMNRETIDVGQFLEGSIASSKNRCLSHL